MIDLYTTSTPNGHKVSCTLEALNLEYTTHAINLQKGEQKTKEFLAMNPNGRIPVIVDRANDDLAIFESGAIMIYLAEKSGKFYDLQERSTINQWLMGQMAYVGPMLGQHHQFHHYNPGKSDFGEKRYFKISKRIYKELDERLMVSKFLAGEEYTIADIATFPWIARHEWHDIGLKKFEGLTRWYQEISKREAVIRGYDLLKKGEKIPTV